MISVDKPCEDCGILMVNVTPRRKYCRDCAIKWQREYQRKFRRKKKAEQEAKVQAQQRYIENKNKDYCDGCEYWCGDYKNNYCCNYIFVEGYSRPCPPGKDCTVKKPKKKGMEK